MPKFRCELELERRETAEWLAVEKNWAISVELGDEDFIIIREARESTQDFFYLDGRMIY